MLSPGLALSKRVTVSSVNSVFSNITTASAPSGIGAPVMMRTAVPWVTGRLGTLPAATSSRTCSVTGLSRLAPALSAARKA